MYSPITTDKMKLDDTISYFYETASYDCYNEEQREYSDVCFQLAEWLNELKSYRDLMRKGNS